MWWLCTHTQNVLSLIRGVATFPPLGFGWLINSGICVSCRAQLVRVSNICSLANNDRSSIGFGEVQHSWAKRVIQMLTIIWSTHTAHRVMLYVILNRHEMHKTLNSWLCSPNITRIRRRVCLLLGRRVTRGNSSVGRVTRGNGTRRRVGSGCWVHTSWTTGVHTSWSTGVRWGGWIASWRGAEGN